MTASKWNALQPAFSTPDDFALPEAAFLTINSPGAEGKSGAEGDASAGDLTIPETLAILPLRGVVVYPLTAIPLTVGQARSVRLVDDAVVGPRVIGLVASRDADLETPGPGDLYSIGTAAVVHRLFRAPDGTIRLLVQGLARFRVSRYTETEPYLKAAVGLAPETSEEGVEVEALVRNVRDLFQRVAELVPSMPGELLTAVINVDDPRQLVYTIATYQRMELKDAQELLEADSVTEKLKRLLGLLKW
jgi:ATP-dependent Lon protease